MAMGAAEVDSSTFWGSFGQLSPQTEPVKFASMAARLKEMRLSESAKSRAMIGPRLRHIRQEKGFTIETLAAAAGLDKGFLSRLERGTKRPSIETVLRLSAALDVPVGQLFGEQTTDDTVRISRAAGRSRALEDPDTYSFELLTPKGSLVEAFLFHVGPVPTGGGQQHDGEELFFVLSGTVEMQTPDRSYILKAGDCAYFPGHLLHRMRRIGSEPATAVIAVGRDRSTVKRQSAAGALTNGGPHEDAAADPAQVRLLNDD